MTSAAWRSVFRDDLFDGKVALVTGGGTGIGKAIATELALTGCRHVVIASRNRDTCVATAAQINDLVVVKASKQGNTTNQDAGTEAKRSDRSCVVVAGPSTSIRNEEQVEALIAFCIEKFGSLDLLVNNAGGQFISPAEDISRRGFMAVVETNLAGTFHVCQAAYRQYMQEHGGSIVNITLGNRNGMPYMIHSGAARAGVENMTATLSTEWIGSNVRINCVRPGIIWTDSGFENYGPAGDMFATKILPSLPAKRFGSPEEIASAVCWLLSEGAAYATGTVLAVDGASAYTFLPLIDIEDKEHLIPFHGTLPRKARL